MRGLALCEQTVACCRHRRPSKPGLRTSELVCKHVRSGNGRRLLATPRSTGEAREYNTEWRRWQLPLELCESIRRCDCEPSRSGWFVEVVGAQSLGGPELPRKRLRSSWVCVWLSRLHVSLSRLAQPLVFPLETERHRFLLSLVCFRHRLYTVLNQRHLSPSILSLFRTGFSLFACLCTSRASVSD